MQAALFKDIGDNYSSAYKCQLSENELEDFTCMIIIFSHTMIALAIKDVIAYGKFCLLIKNILG